MIPATNVYATGSGRPRHLGMATETQVGIRLGEHPGVDGTVRVVADRAAFAQGRVFKNKWPGLFPMALGARFIQPRHGQSARRFHDVQTMRVVALDTVHFSLKHRMMLGKMKFSLRLQMTLEAGLRVLARIDDEFVQTAPAAPGDVFAARTVAGFTTVLTGHSATFQMQPGVWTGGKGPGNVLVTVRTGFVPDERGAFDLQWHNHRAFRRGTGIDQKKEQPGARNQPHSGQPVQSLCL